MHPKQVFGNPAPGLLSERRRVQFCSRCGSNCEERVVNGETRSVCGSCGFVHYVNPLPAVSVLVHRNSEVLLVRRNAGMQQGLWCLPCGAVELHEDYLTAARREVREESGLAVRLTGLLSVCSNFFETGLVSLVVMLLAEPVGGVLEALDRREISEARWFAPDSLPEMAFEADVHIIARYFATRTEGAPLDSDFAQAGSPVGQNST